MSSRASEPLPRSLADDLRLRDDDALAALLRARPDLAHPVPGDVTALAVRAATRASIARALDRLDQFTLQVVEALCLQPDPGDYRTTRGLLGGVDPRHALHDLRTVALIWGEDDELRVMRTLRELVGTPAGLGPPARTLLAGYGPARLARLLSDLGQSGEADPVAAVEAISRQLADPDRLADLLAQAQPAAHEALAVLAWGPPAGHLAAAERDVTVTSAKTPVEWLLAHGLLVATDRETVVLPREVALHLRGGRPHAEITQQPPAVDRIRLDAAAAERAAAGTAFGAVRRIEDLLDAWADDPPTVLRAGGLGVRELRRAAGLLHVEEPVAALLIETAFAAGLVGASGETDDRWLPTPAFDAWREQEAALRWSSVAAAWLDGTRVAGLVGERDDRERPLAALGPDLDRVAAPELRRELLAELAELTAGTAATRESLTARLAWRSPRKGGRLQAALIRWALAEAEALGVTGRGALPAAGRALLAGDAAAAAGALAPLLPRPLDRILLQADLTAVAPGPLERDLGHELALAADVESRGGATVYRFTETSVRRALDAGRSAGDLRELLAAHSSTPVPQPLSYLIDDVARRHGRIRAGTASAYLRCDDEATLAELLADRRAAGLRLRRLAPTVLAAQAPVDVVLERLRAIGYAPMAETAEGELVVRRPDARRTPPRQRPLRLVGEPPAPSEALVSATVRALRAGDRASTAPRSPVPLTPAAGQGSEPPRTTSVATLSALRTAVESRRPLWIGYVDNAGTASERVVEPVQVQGGYLTAYDLRQERVRSFAVHRITGVATLDAEDAT